MSFMNSKRKPKSMNCIAFSDSFMQLKAKKRKLKEKIVDLKEENRNLQALNSEMLNSKMQQQLHISEPSSSGFSTHSKYVDVLKTLKERITVQVDGVSATLYFK